MTARAVQCPSCRAPTPVRPDTTAQRCQYCGFDFAVQATHAAAAEIERATGARLAPHRARIDELARRAEQAAAAGDRAAAEQLTRDKIAIYGGVYRETGYYQLMGLAGEEAIAAYEQRWIAAETPGAPAGATAAGGAGAGAAYERYLEALEARDFAALVDAYLRVCREQASGDEAAARQAVRDMAWNLPWATDEQLRSIGVPCSTPSAGAVACANCGAALEVAGAVESIDCPYCAATTRLRISRQQAYEVRGATPEQAAAQVAAERAAGRDLGAALESTRAIVAGQAEPGSPRERELLYYYGLATHPWLAAEQDALLARLGLSPPKTCRSCEQSVALALDGDGRCPMCQQRP